MRDKFKIDPTCLNGPDPSVVVKVAGEGEVSPEGHASLLGLLTKPLVHRVEHPIEVGRLSLVPHQNPLDRFLKNDARLQEE